MHLLAALAPFHAGHEDLFRGHEGQLGKQVLFDLLRVDDHISGNIDVQLEDRVAEQEGLGQVHAADGRVVQGALEPLVGRGGREIGGQAHEFAGEAGHPLAAHGVALVGHGRAAHLLALERLLLHLQVGQEPQVHRELVRRGGDAGQGFGDLHVELARVGLAGDCEHLVKADLLRHPPVQLAHPGVVTVEQLDEGGLGAHRALGAAGLDLAFQLLHVVQVHEQILEVEGGPLAHRGRLGRLVVSEAERCQILVFLCKISEIGNDLDQRPLDQGERALLDEQVGVADHELRGGAQVDDRLGQRALLTVGEHVRHDVVADLAFLGPGQIVVDIVHVGLQLGDHVRGHRGQAEFVLGLGQGHPATAPVGELEPLGKQFLHLPTGVAGHQGLLIDVVIHGQLVKRMVEGRRHDGGAGRFRWIRPIPRVDADRPDAPGPAPPGFRLILYVA